jgi:DeoD family purine-nucleoside phosphorylase|tara:strand:+ start:10862 stop:11641 length:780 start_codon:yes stop_codon:yes gene_type:complete
MTKAWPETKDLPDANDPTRSQYRALRCIPGEIAPNVLVPGDPGRAAKIASEWLTGAKLMMVQREFHSYTGEYKGMPVSVISTGIGCPSAAMVMQDLGKHQCKNVIRVGTAGSCHIDVRPGDNVIGIAAVRDEGLTEKFLPAIYPAVADLKVINALKLATKKQNIKTHTGVVHTSDAFSSPKLENDIQLAQTAGILAFEMEAAAILMLGALYKIRAGCIFSIDGFVKNISDGDVKPDSNACNRGIESAIESSLEAMLILS